MFYPRVIKIIYLRLIMKCFGQQNHNIIQLNIKTEYKNLHVCQIAKGISHLPESL